jgi:ubiquinone/menaquinone biosynthesis C-methylase UbiE
MGLLDRIFRKPQPQQKAAVSPTEIAAFFNEAAKDEEHFPSTIDPRILHVRAVLDHMGDLNGKRVADAGSGKGRFATLMKQNSPGATVSAIDIAEAMLRHVPAGVERCAGSLTALPLASESCHGVYATESLEHAVDIELAISELCRILVPGGRLAIIDKNKDHWGRFNTPAWEKWFGQHELERMLSRHCRKVESRPISYWEEETPDGLFLIWTAEK